MSLPDTTAAVFKALRRWMYAMYFKFDPATVMDVLHLAEKYDLPTLAELCALHVESEVSWASA